MKVNIRRYTGLALALSFGLSLFISIIPVAAAGLPCTTATTATQGNLCILEIQTKGVTGNEDEDFVIIANLTPQNLTSTSIQLQYINSQGILDSGFSIGTFTAGQVKTYVSDGLKDANPSASKLGTTTASMPLASAGGTLQVSRTSGSTTTVYDKVGWGTATKSEGLPTAIQDEVATLTRREVNGIIQDSDNNNVDFVATQMGCRGASFSEIQPYVTDENGDSIDAWVELTGTALTQGDCLLTTGSGDTYKIPAADLPLQGETKTINRGLDVQNQPVVLHIGDASGQVWLDGVSHFGGQSPVRVPFNTQSYSNLVKGQSWALVDGVWHRTFSLTPNASNIYTPTPPINDNDPNACLTVRITEVFPNPTGEDTGNEWIELYNDSEVPARLSNCKIDIAGTSYSFLNL